MEAGSRRSRASHDQDVEATCLDQVDQTRTAKNLRRRLELLAYKVTLDKIAADE
jgi:hypothetical protein